jgi:hypothetical protein
LPLHAAPAAPTIDRNVSQPHQTTRSIFHIILAFDGTNRCPKQLLMIADANIQAAKNIFLGENN